MKPFFVPFDEARRRVIDAVGGVRLPDRIERLYIVRNMFGKISLSVSDAVEGDGACREALRALACKVSAAAGAHGLPAEESILFIDESLIDEVVEGAWPVGGLDRIYWADRAVTGNDWLTVGSDADRRASRFTLYSAKGGVGLTTTAAILAWRLAHEGERVLVVDLDLESPGLSPVMLGEKARPEFGVADWFVEELAGHGRHIAERMTGAPDWARETEGDVRVAPAHGARPGEYLAKLGRIYMDTDDYPWNARLKKMLGQLESGFTPTAVLIESHSGLGDIAAAAVNDIDPDTMLFATGSGSCWADYDILFHHWKDKDLAKDIRKRLSIVSALTPPDGTAEYLGRFREKSWALFRNGLYDAAPESDDSGGGFTFDLNDDDAPHSPRVIYWNRGLAADASLLDPDRKRDALTDAYGDFFAGFRLPAPSEPDGETR